MRRILVIALAAACGLSAEPVAEVLQRSQQFERAGETIRARAVLARAAGEAESDVETQLAYAEFLDRYRDPARRGAYEKALGELGSSSDEQRRSLLRRLVVLSLIEGDSESAKKYVGEYRASGGAEMQQLERSLERTGDSGGLPMGSAEIPGLLEGFRRMAALSSDQRLDELMPALARNVMTSGYRTGRGAEALQQTEYLKLVLRYLSQARELKEFAGPNGSIDVPDCESQQTAQLLKILGFRLRNDCGPSAVLETVNPSRAFLSIDSAFPLADLEEAYRRERAFQLDYPSTTLPVIFGTEYWLSGAKKRDKAVDFIDIFLGDPSLARLYVAMSNLHEPTAMLLREQVSIEQLKNMAHVLDFFGGMFEVENGRAMVPGGPEAEKAWEDLIEVSPAEPAAFFMKLMKTDDGWVAAFFDSLWRVDDKALRYFTEPKRMRRFYLAVRGKTTSPGPARPIFRANADLLLLTTRLHLTPDGQAYIPGGLEPWKKVFAWHEHAIWDGKRNREAAMWSQPDDIVESMYVFCRRAVNNDPLRMFISITNIDRHRKTPLRPATVQRLTEDFAEHGQIYPIFADAPMLTDETIVAYLDVLPRLMKVRRVTRRADAIGIFQALTGLWQILMREGQIPEEKADGVLRSFVELFQDVRGDLPLFDAGRAGVRNLLAATGSAGDSPQQRMLELLAGDPAPADQSAHAQVVEQMNSLFTQQRLVSLKTLFDLADHLERVSRGESFNVAMANRLASRISEVPLPRSELSTFESNSFAHGNWVDKHLERQRSLNLRRLVDRAQGNSQKLAEVRGELAPILRDSLVGLNYVHYSPPGAELIRANPLFVRGHDFLGVQEGSSWRTTRMLGTGWPNSGGGRLVGSLVGLPYALAEAEQNFLVPVKRQALIWQDLAPQILLSATVPKWWRITAAEQHFVGLHLRLSEELVARASFESELHTAVFSRLRRKVEPARLFRVRDALEWGRVQEGIGLLTASELFHLAADYLGQHGDAAGSGPVSAEIMRLRGEMPDKLGYERLGRLFGVPHPRLTESYRPMLLNVPLFPTLMGYSSRILAESWESSNLYWAALADESHIAPSRLNLLVPRWTQKSLERIFATHLDDWPALWRSMRIVAADQRKEIRPRVEQMVEEALD